MAYCYRCGRKIEPGETRQPRRKVRTGEWIRKGYGKKPVQGVQSHYGMRIVCPNCAKRIDAENLWQGLQQDLKFIFALLVLFALIGYLYFLRSNGIS